MIPLMSEEFEKDHPVTAQTIKCFAIVLGASCNVLVFFVAPIVTIILVSQNLAVVAVPRMWTSSSRALLELLFDL
ncbi:hypothetical protein Ddc_24089 [Ditylenchus destructor]|nr:hypothetical protein Ddc_24089 [Ditylenchus destructor]